MGFVSLSTAFWRISVERDCRSVIVDNPEVRAFYGSSFAHLSQIAHRRGGDLTRSSFLLGFGPTREFLYVLVPAAILFGCAQGSVTPQPAQQPNPSLASGSDQSGADRTRAGCSSRFHFDFSSVGENASALHRGADLFRSSSAEERRIEIGRGAAVRLSAQAAKRLSKMGLPAVRVPPDSDMPLCDNTLLVTGRLNQVDEGNRFTRIALGLGAGESRLTTEVHVFRVMHGERAEVLSFTTHADSGKMPGILPSMGVGELMLGPIKLITAIKDAASSAQKIYSSQMEYLAGKTADQVAAYFCRSTPPMKVGFRGNRSNLPNDFYKANRFCE